MIRIINNSIQRADLSVVLYFNRSNSRIFIQRFLYGLSRFGDGHLYVIWGISNLLFNGEWGQKFFYTGLLAFAIELPVYFIIKKSVKRERPSALIKDIKSLIIPPDQFSFPSGHTAAAFLMATLISFQFPFLRAILYFFAGLIGFSRIYLRVHFPSDVLAGVVLGIISANLSYMILF